MTHHERVIDGETEDLIHALRFDLIGIRDIARQMLLITRRRKRTGNAEQNDGLALQIVRDIQILHPTIAKALESDGGDGGVWGDGHG